MKRNLRHAARGAANSRLLGLIIASTFAVSITNLAIGRRASLHHQHQEHDPGILPFRDDIHYTNSEKVYSGQAITDILTGKKPIPRSHGRLRLKYKPGSLHMSSADVLQHCFVNVTHYQGHITHRKHSLVSLSDHHKIIYRNNPKASSSSARHAMQDFLEGGDERMKHDDMEDKVHKEKYSMISFVREPLNRFYSSYDEAFFRMGPWMGGGPIVRDKPRVRQAYLNSKHKMDKYPYLYEGFKTIDDFRRYYCPEEVLATGKFLDCNRIPSIDDGNLAHRFEQFIRDYSGIDPFDIHLNIQISNLIFPTGEPFPITALYNATEAEKEWQEIASLRGVTIPDGEMTHGRKITRRFNVSKVSDATKQKICRLLALDYCCLNIKLPDVCTEGRAGENGAVYCAMEQRDDETMKFALKPLVVQAWKDP